MVAMRAIVLAAYNRRVTRGRAAAALFAIAWIVYVPGYMGCHDTMWTIPTAVSLIDRGDATLDEYQPLIDWRGAYHTRRIEGHTYTIHPIGVAISAIPGVIVLRPVAAAIARFAPSLWSRMRTIQAERGCEPDGGEPVLALQTWTEHAIAAALVAATAVIMFVIAADELPVSWALALAVVFAFATSAWSTASRAMWAHTPSMLLLAAALLLQRRGGRAVWIGLLLAFAYIVRPTDAIPFAAAALWLALVRPRALPEFALGAAVVFVPFLASNLAMYRAWLPPYFTSGFYAHNTFVGEALVGDLVSPSRGLFVFSPVLLLSIAGFAIKASARRLTMLDLSLAGCIIAHWVTIAASVATWWAGHAYGPRFFADMLPYLIDFMIPAVAWIAPLTTPARRAGAAALAIASIFSIAVHAQGALNQETVAWNGYPVNIDDDPVRVWDWRHPQFLAGLTFVPRPEPVDFASVPCTKPPGSPGQPAVVSVDGSSVVLRWDAASGGVVAYLVEAGRAPGGRDLPTRVVLDVSHPSVTINRVQPGTYHMRVVARNGCGDSPASPEIEVLVR
jgi:fibronectin type III domain protein